MDTRMRPAAIGAALIAALLVAVPAAAAVSYADGWVGASTASASPDDQKSSSEAPGKKKGCKKGKKKGCPKPVPVAEVCDAFAPGEIGSEAETITLTEANSEAAPLEYTVTLADSAADADLTGMALQASYAYVNIQLDSPTPDAGVYAFIEFPERNDFDLNLFHTDGSYAARSRAFQPVIETNDVKDPVLGFGLSETGHGGESTSTSEKLVGIRTSDCGGWTLQVANYLGFGGDFVVKLWAGDPVNDPLPPGEQTP